MKFPRNVEKTKKRILEAVGELLATKGFESIGVNAIARHAKCDKVLIYRYFSGLPSLLEAFGRQSGFWPSIKELTQGGEGASLSKAAPTFFRNLVSELRKRPITIEVMRWEMVQSNELTQTIAKIKENQGKELFEMLMEGQEETSHFDLQASAAVLTAGIYHLLLREAGTEEYLGINLRSEEGWTRITEAAAQMASMAIERSAQGKAEESE